MPVKITLSPEQLALAEAEAYRRQLHNESRGSRGRNRAPEKGEKALKMHLLGCVGEVAVADYLGLEEHLFQAQTAIRGSADLPGNIEVKTRSKHGYDLLVQFSDNSNKIFVLVTYETGSEARIHGWISGKDAMKPQYIRELVRGRPCYVILQSLLRSVETLGQVSTETEACVLEGQDEGVILRFSPDLMQKLGWRAGDTLEFEPLAEDGMILRRA